MKAISIFLFAFLLMSTSLAQSGMTKQEVYNDIEKTLGKVPSFFKLIPERSLELEKGNFSKHFSLKKVPFQINTGS